MIEVLQIVCNVTCPFDCYYCSIDKDTQERDMAFEEIAQNVDYFMNEKGITDIVLSGGEITTRQDFKEILDYVNAKKPRFCTVITNGKLWDTELTSYCKGKITRAVVAFSFPDEQLMRNIELMQDNGIMVQTNTVILKQNCHNLSRIAEMVDRLRIKNPIFTFPFPTGRIRNNIENIVSKWNDIKTILFESIQLLQNPLIKNVPLCYLDAQYKTVTTQRYVVTANKQLGNHKVSPPCFRETQYIDKCFRCNEKSNCDGLSNCDGFWIEYIKKGILVG